MRSGSAAFHPGSLKYLGLTFPLGVRQKDTSKSFTEHPCPRPPPQTSETCNLILPWVTSSKVTRGTGEIQDASKEIIAGLKDFIIAGWLTCSESWSYGDGLIDLDMG